MPIDLIEDTSLLESSTSNGPNWWAAGIGLTIIFIAGLVYWHLHKRHAMPGPTTMKKPVNPAIDAMKRLAELKESYQAMSSNAFSLSVSEILRVFIEERFAIPAAHQSTEEFMAEMVYDDRLNEALRESLQHFLFTCDLAKFARHDLAEERKLELHEQAYTFVYEFQRTGAKADNLSTAGGQA
ncbi:hypothetical protein [Cerasicoccus fimbriatus]|uniref:hypothetical protein n=1 Tax=Cerasicoccus fimbriatus TaxID=3014554 RepID=UPI0022B5C206|nr:hypothetical protein [Cerasicoccus sp. TK19100]